MRNPLSPRGVPSRRPAPSRRILLAAFLVFLFCCMLIPSHLFAANPAGVSLDVPASAKIGDVIKVKVNINGGSEGIWFTTSGLRQIRGYFDHCGWCSAPCLVDGAIQTCSDCCGPYCLSCTWSSGHEFSDTWFGGPTIEYEVTGCGTATIRPTYYGGSHEGPFTLDTYEIEVLNGIVADFEDPGIGCVGDTIKFKNKSCGGITYFWDFGDGGTSSEESPTHIYEKEGAYTVQLTASSHSDSDTATKGITIGTECATIEGKTLFAPNGTALPGVSVRAYGSTLGKDTGAVSDASGYYKMIVAAREPYSLLARMPGFVTEYGPPVTLEPKQVYPWNVSMKPDVPKKIDTSSLRGKQSNNVEDPVNPATGNYFLNLRLLKFPGVRHIDFDFQAAYNASAAMESSPLGYGWTHSYNIFLTSEDDRVTVHFGDGHREFFQFDASSGEYRASNCRPSIELFPLAPQGWKAHTGGGLYWEFNAEGKLTRIYDLNNNAMLFEYSDYLAKITDTQGRVIQFAYENGLLAHITTPQVISADTLAFAYDGDKNLTSITDPRGHAWTFSYDAKHRLITETDRKGITVLTNVYDDSDRVIEQNDGLGLTTRLSYEETLSGKRVHVTMPSGNGYTHEYDPNYNLLAITDPAGFKAIFAPGENGKPRSVIDKKGEPAFFTSTSLGLTTEAIDRLGLTTRVSYNDKHQVTSVIDPAGRAVSASYDSKGNMTALEDTTFDYTKFSVNSRGQSTKINYSASGGNWEMAYHSDGSLKSVKDYNKNVTTYTYDAAGRVLQMDYPSGFGSVKNQYDAGGNLVRRESPLGFRTSFTHDENDRVLTRTFEPTGAVTTYVYDNAGHTKTITDPLGGVTTNTFDPSGNVVASEDPDGVVTRFEYDKRNQLSAVIASSGNKTRFGYDANGNRVRMSNHLGRTWQWTYDAAGRCTSTQDPLGHTTRYQRNEANTLLQKTNPLHQTFSQRFDDGGKLSSFMYPDGKEVSFHRNTAGELMRLQDEKGNSWRYSHDAMGRTVRVTDPVGNAENYAYDAMGRITKLTRRSGDSIEYAYDLDGRLTGMTPSFGFPVSYAYPYDGITGASTTTTTTTKNETDSIVVVDVYDRMDRLVSHTDAWGKTMTYAYTPAGRLKSIGYPNGKNVDYAYDNHGRLHQVTDWNGNTTTYSYDAMDRVSQVDLPNGSRTVYAYDARDALAAIRHQRDDGSDIVGFTLTRDALGRIVKTNRIGESPAASIENTVKSQTYDPANRILTQTDGGDTRTFTFDVNGNMTAKAASSESTTCHYDIFHRLTSVDAGSKTTSYAYDADGRRLSMLHNGTETRYQRMGDVILTFSDGEDHPLLHHVYAQFLLYSFNESGALRVYHADPRGSVAAVTDDDQTIVQTYAYGPFGDVIASPGNLPDNPFTYAGTSGVLHDPNGLFYMQARYYDASIGRFLTEDPLGALPGANVYAYAGADPVNRTDPAGLWDNAATSDLQNPSAGTEPLAYSAKPTTTFEIDPRAEEINFDYYNRNGTVNYRQALLNYYDTHDKGKARELRHILSQYDGMKESLDPRWHNIVYTPGDVNRPLCVGVTASMLGINDSSQYNANLKGLQELEVVHVGIGLQPDGSFKHHAPGVVDKSTGQVIMMLDSIPMSDILGIPMPTGQKTSIIPYGWQGWTPLNAQVYDFEGGIMPPNEWLLSRTYANCLGASYGVGIVPETQIK